MIYTSVEAGGKSIGHGYFDREPRFLSRTRDNMTSVGWIFARAERSEGTVDLIFLHPDRMEDEYRVTVHCAAV